MTVCDQLVCTQTLILYKLQEPVLPAQPVMKCYGSYDHMIEIAAHWLFLLYLEIVISSSLSDECFLYAWLSYTFSP